MKCNRTPLGFQRALSGPWQCSPPGKKSGAGSTGSTGSSEAGYSIVPHGVVYEPWLSEVG